MERLREKARQWNIELTNQQIEQFQSYYEMLVETNKVMNLTTITELEEVITKHFLDSLALAEIYPEIRREKLYVLDLGTGAGFPGVPLKIAFPKLDIVLMDSLNKRIRFLQSVIDTLDLCDITAVHGRAEEAAKNAAYREHFDLCVSRAVANLAVLAEYCIPFVKIGGRFIPYKSGEIEEEAEMGKKAVSTMGGRITEIKKLVLPDSDISRSFVMIDKNKNTPKLYPRKAGTAGREPIQ